jgi:hypothetical protein
METTQTVTITVASTENVSLFEWKNKTRIQVTEARGRMAEVSEIETDELLCGVSYWIRRLVDDSSRTDRQTRILTEIATKLAQLQSEQVAA